MMEYQAGRHFELWFRVEAEHEISEVSPSAKLASQFDGLPGYGSFDALLAQYEPSGAFGWKVMQPTLKYDSDKQLLCLVVKVVPNANYNDRDIAEMLGYSKAVIENNACDWSFEVPSELEDYIIGVTSDCVFPEFPADHLVDIWNVVDSWTELDADDHFQSLHRRLDKMTEEEMKGLYIDLRQIAEPSCRSKDVRLSKANMLYEAVKARMQRFVGVASDRLLDQRLRLLGTK